MPESEPAVLCSHCKGAMYSQVVQHGAAVQWRCPRCHIHVRVPAGMTLTAGPFVVTATA